MIKKRQEQILNKLIKFYISSFDPVSSNCLKERCSFGLSSATIRHEMQVLTEMGYLYKPHTSSGRIPTDKGYRFFVDSLKERKNNSSEKVFKKIKKIRKKTEDRNIFLKEFNRIISSISSSLTISYLLDDGIFIKEGWSSAFNGPEFSDIKKVREFLLMVDRFEERIDDFNLDFFSARVYIGDEAPSLRSKDFSLIVSKCVFFNEKEGIVAILGPKRMAYDKNIFLLNSISKILNNNNL